MEDKYSKKNLEEFACDLIKYLYKTRDYNGDRLSENVGIYTMDKLYYVDEEKSNFKLKDIPVCIKENYKIEDYFEYAEGSPLVVSMDARLCEYLYYGDVYDEENPPEKVQKNISTIFKQHGFYYDFGSSWYIIACDPNKLK